MGLSVQEGKLPILLQGDIQRQMTVESEQQISNAYLNFASNYNMYVPYFQIEVTHKIV